MKNAVAQKIFSLALQTETFVAPNNIFESGRVYPISPQNAYEAQEVRGLALDKLMQSTSKTHASENFKQNSTKAANHVITDHTAIENWMLEKLGKYNKLQNTK